MTFGERWGLEPPSPGLTTSMSVGRTRPPSNAMQLSPVVTLVSKMVGSVHEFSHNIPDTSDRDRQASRQTDT